ncbi:hypothetical protein PtB15_12B548 [Puccinia triticina]|nr:hypothetical protein PtB15_12B548 [Puccinia triticina]
MPRRQINIQQLVLAVIVGWSFLVHPGVPPPVDGPQLADSVEVGGGVPQMIESPSRAGVGKTEENVPPTSSSTSEDIRGKLGGAGPGVPDQTIESPTRRKISVPDEPAACWAGDRKSGASAASSSIIDRSHDYWTMDDDSPWEWAVLSLHEKVAREFNKRSDVQQVLADILEHYPHWLAQPVLEKARMVGGSEARGDGLPMVDVPRNGAMLHDPKLFDGRMIQQVKNLYKLVPKLLCEKVERKLRWDSGKVLYIAWQMYGAQGAVAELKQLCPRAPTSRAGRLKAFVTPPPRLGCVGRKHSTQQHINRQTPCPRRHPPTPASTPIMLTVLLLLLLPASQALAGSEIIETSSVSYCSEPRAILVDTFDVRYSKRNQTLAFDLSAASVSRGLNLEAQLSLNAYGIHALNLSIDLCSVLSGVLCPLPTYNFTGSGQYAIPPDRIPAIPALAWAVPDIEAVFTIQLVDSTSSLPAACLQVTLTNGLSVGHRAVAWLSAASLILAALIALIAAALAPESARLSAPASLFYLLGNQLQQMAMAGMLSLNYPVVLRTWTTNFAYSVGLISSPSISRAIDDLRDRTGGNGFSTTQDTVAFISRLYSPFNQQPGTVDTHTDTSTSARALFVKDTMHQMIAGAYQHAPLNNNFTTTTTHHLRARQALDSSGFTPTVPRPRHTVPVVTRNTTLLDPGLAAYVNKVGFPVENAFMFLFMWLLILTAFLLACFLLVSLTLLILPPSSRAGRRSPIQKLARLSPVGLAIGLRVLLFAYPPLSLFTFWQWRLGNADARAPIFFAVVLWLASSLALAFIAWRLFRHHSRGHPWNWSIALVGMFKPGKWWILGPLTLISLLRAAFIGFGQGSGQTQVISEMILLTISFGLMVVHRPFGATLTNVAAIIQATMAVIQSVILQFLVPSLETKPIPRTVLGFAIIVLHSIGFLAAIVFGGWPLIGELRTVFSRDRGDRLAVVEPDDREKFNKEPEDAMMAEPDHSINRMTLTDSQNDHSTRLSQPSAAEDATLTLHDDDQPLYLEPTPDHQPLKDHRYHPNHRHA